MELVPDRAKWHAFMSAILKLLVRLSANLFVLIMV
jgi:hypothetical protein